MVCKFQPMDNFLWCISLETGGYVIGWLTSGFAFLGIILCVKSILTSIFSSHYHTSSNFLVMYAVYLFFYFILLYASIQLVKASKSKSHNPIRLYLVIMCIGIIASLLQALYGGTTRAIVAVVGVIFFGYIFTSVYSLYAKLKKQNLQQVTQALQATATQALQAQEPPNVVIMKY